MRSLPNISVGTGFTAVTDARQMLNDSDAEPRELAAEEIAEAERELTDIEAAYRAFCRRTRVTANNVFLRYALGLAAMKPLFFRDCDIDVRIVMPSRRLERRDLAGASGVLRLQGGHQPRSWTRRGIANGAELAPFAQRVPETESQGRIHIICVNCRGVTGNRRSRQH